ncbi:homeobox protein 12-like [Trichogramma pretiosum]|uniref:homeobox protein 12-like n=1 Tax=Trichogramma pretiosum TaxID=7493 RepID=UPI000C719AA4|nr:homeobox protein 12-like [Trichogramma pretiosum]
MTKRGNHSMVLHHLTQEYKRNKFTCLATVQLEIWPLPDASQMDNMLIFWITFFCAGNLGQSAVFSENVWPQNDQMFNAHIKTFSNHNSYDNIHITTNSPLELPKTKVAPAVTNLLGTENFQNNMQSLEVNPSILSAESGLQYRTEPGFNKAHDFRYHKPNNNNQKVKFSSYNDPPYTNPINVLPLQTNNAPQLPKYKGAVVQPYANRAFAKFPNDYEEFKSQPLLHFNNKGNNSPIPFNDPPKKNKYKTGKIKPGIEIVTHSSPTSTIKEEDDENSYEESNNENKNIDSYLPRDEDDTVDEPEKYFGEPGFESNFEPSKTHIFKHYEEDFQNNNKPLSEAYHEDNTKDDNYQVNLAAKYRYNISENENDYITTIKPESQDDFSGPYSEEEEDNTEERKKEENNSNSSLETISHETENSSKFPVKTYADSFYKNYKAKTKQNQALKIPKSGESRSYSSFHRVNSSPKTTRKNSRPNNREKLSVATSSFSLESPFQSADFDFPILKDNSFNSHKNTSYSRKTKWNNEGNKRHKNSRHTSEDVAREKSAEKSVLENLETFDY